MSANHDLERRIADHYAAETPPRAPDWVLERILASVDTTQQRRTMLGLPWRIPTMPSTLAKLALTAVAIATVGLAGLTFLWGPVIGPAASPSPSPVTPTPSPRSEAEQIIAEGNLNAFAASRSGTVLTVWGTCGFLDTDCGNAWRLGSGSTPQATGMVDGVDAHVYATASGDRFILTPGRGYDQGLRIAQDGTASPLSMACRDASWSTPTEPGRLVWTAGPNFVDTVAGVICPTSRLGGRPLARGAFTADGTLWALVDNEAGPGTLTIGWYDGVQWRYHDLGSQGGSWTSVLAAAGSNVVVLQAGHEPSHQRLVGLSVTTDAGATWPEVVDPDVLERDLPFSPHVHPDSQIWLSDYTSMAFAGTSVLYVADGIGSLWRSTDFATFSRVSVPGGVRDLTSAGDAVIARIDNEGTCQYPAACQLNDLIRISADGSVEPLTVR